MVSYPVGTKLYCVYRPQKYGHPWNTGYWFQIENGNPDDRTSGRFEWDPDRRTTFSLKEASVLPWGRKPPFAESEAHALVVTSADSEPEHQWCWLYVGTIWSLED